MEPQAPTTPAPQASVDLSPMAAPQPQTQPPAPNPVQLVAQKPKNNLIIIIAAILLIISLGIIGYLVFQSLQSKKQTTKVQPTPTPSSILTPTPDITANWEKYTNTQYGFEIKHPSEYKALSDEKNLYGWPKAIVLFYKGGQSYDLAIEIWDNESEYKQKYIDSSVITIFKTQNNKFITLLNANKDPEVDQIISTFKFVDQNIEGKSCGGIAANLPENQCPEGYHCKLENNYPDASGVCVKD